MGANSFTVRIKGKNANEAFHTAVECAKYDNGHGGYTGTIAEKTSFVKIPLPEGRRAEEHAYELLRDSDARINDKWGPAGCFDLSEGEFVFFGWASS